jgi:hypothetical protein
LKQALATSDVLIHLKVFRITRGGIGPLLSCLASRWIGGGRDGVSPKLGNLTFSPLPDIVQDVFGSLSESHSSSILRKKQDAFRKKVRQTPVELGVGVGDDAFPGVREDC